jgi:hypothetical protein
MTRRKRRDVISIPMPFPPLPTELERMIFEAAANWPAKSVGTIRNLMLVSRRVHAWMERIFLDSLYIVHDQQWKGLPTLVRTLEKKSPDFIKSTVKTLMAAGNLSLPSMRRILSLCCGVTKLYMSLDEFKLPYESIANLRPTTLSTSLQSIYDWPVERFFELPFFEKVTHLELQESFADYAGLPFHCLPCLTHLAFSEIDSVWDVGAANQLVAMFNRCPRLQVVLLLVDEPEDTLPLKEVFRNISLPRLFVALSQFLEEDWDDHLNGEDNWARADRINPVVEGEREAS